MKKIKGFKGFDKNLRCRGFQYEIGKEYFLKGPIKCCEFGYHFCKNPLHIFKYYSPSCSRYCKVEGYGETDSRDNEVATSNIRIVKEVNLNDIIQASLDNTMTRRKSRAANCSVAISKKSYSAATNSGTASIALNSGLCSIAANSGNKSIAKTIEQYSTAINTGCNSVAMSSGTHSIAINRGTDSVVKVNGKESVAIAIGMKSKASGELGCWLVLTERDRDYNIINMKCVKVDGRKIKPDTYYELKNGEVVEA